MESATRLSDEEVLVYNIIKQETRVSGGILQSKLRERDELRSIQSRRLYTIVNKLARANLIKRIAINDNGQTAYLLQAIDQRNQIGEQRISIPDSEIFAIPCNGCRNLYMCGEGRVYNPLKCPYLTRFLMERAYTVKT
ncbi:MAG: hypothetical protein QXJ56_07260 [Ignisphaera sp.]|uniref:Uncharacterized protein n=1 Tax=Ignisphaera aggregans TaxID=334771 RepID=A0A7J3JS25_9CREN